MENGAMNLTEMTDEDYFAAFKGLFSNPGWGVFMSTLENEIRVLHDIGGIKNLENLYFRKGQVAVLERLLGLETSVLNAEDSQGEQETQGAVH